jgi:hypothetical protein
MTNPTIILTRCCRALANQGSVAPHFGQEVASEEISVSHIPHGINLVATKASLNGLFFWIVYQPKKMSPHYSSQMLDGALQHA